MVRPSRLLLVVALAAAWPAPAVLAQAAGDGLDRRAQALLTDRCYPCHGPDAASRRADLRLDDGAAARAPRRAGAAVVPGDPAASLVLRRVRTIDPELRMPPPEAGPALSEAEVGLLRDWIAAGAAFPVHWAYQPPREHHPPELLDDRWSRDPLDRFVLARGRSAGLEPAPEADRATWLRRVSFDLTGLPPGEDERAAFLADQEPGAHERVVDRLLASPRFGERLASDWLDVARYADTYGYQNDVGRFVWPWRDWVVEAFNANLPWSDVITWQLAGDLLPEATRAQRLATTFQRLHRMTNEGGSVEEEFRLESVADRVDTFGTAFLGMTLSCARCHDHKFDPVSQRDYFALSAFFDDIDEAGLYSHFTPAVPTPTLALPDADQQRRLDAARVRLEQADRALARALAAPPDDELGGPLDLADACQAWVDFEQLAEDGSPRNRAAPDTPTRLVDDPALGEGPRGRGLELGGDDGLRLPEVGAFARWEPFTLALWVRDSERADRAVVLHRSRAWTDAGSQGYQLLLEDGRVQAALIHFWPGDAVALRSVEPLPRDRWVHLALRHDGSGRASGLELWVDGAPVATEVLRDELTRSLRQAGGLVLSVGERFRDRGFRGGAVDELAVFGRWLDDAELRHLAAGRGLDEPVQRTAEELGRDRQRRHDPVLQAAVEERLAARRELAEATDAVPVIMTMRDRQPPRVAHVLERGSYRTPGAVVEPGVPEALLPLGDGRPVDRLDLARWLLDDDHPLTARVAVNRFWQLVFGRGLVETSEDLGRQGRPPSHPELLDSLAVQFRASGWDVKALLRRLVLSATYRQSSRADDRARALDPDNRLLMRAPVRRLTAEMLRDQALAVSDLLVERRGGPPVKPYQPEGLWQETSGVAYVPDEGEGLWRRSLYTYWKRTAPPPAPRLFDASKRDVCVTRRQATATPLQSLALWNDPQLVEASRALAALVLEAGDETTGADGARLERLGSRVLGRALEEPEQQALAGLLAVAREGFAEAPEGAGRLVTLGRSEAGAGLPADELAAWTLVASTLLASDGAVTLR